eukprot:Hpha_TRINITY_DN9697_c0_g1::TRINITY_DN9697_c0_g1_i1::g.184511::m.184511
MAAGRRGGPRAPTGSVGSVGDPAAACAELRRLFAHIVLNARIDFGSGARSKVMGAFSSLSIDVDATAESERALESTKAADTACIRDPLWIGVCLPRTPRESELLELWKCEAIPPQEMRRGGERQQQAWIQQQKRVYVRQLYACARLMPLHRVAARIMKARNSPQQLRYFVARGAGFDPATGLLREPPDPLAPWHGPQPRSGDPAPPTPPCTAFFAAEQRSRLPLCPLDLGGGWKLSFEAEYLPQLPQDADVPPSFVSIIPEYVGSGGDRDRERERDRAMGYSASTSTSRPVKIPQPRASPQPSPSPPFAGTPNPGSLASSFSRGVSSMPDNPFARPPEARKSPAPTGGGGGGRCRTGFVEVNAHDVPDTVVGVFSTLDVESEEGSGEGADVDEEEEISNFRARMQSVTLSNGFSGTHEISEVAVQTRTIGDLRKKILTMKDETFRGASHPTRSPPQCPVRVPTGP